MICHTMSAQVGAIEQVINAVKSGELSQRDIQTSLDRVRRLKAKYAIQSPNIPLQTLLSTSLRDIEVSNTANAILASDMYAKSTTIVRSEPGVIPISLHPPKKKIVFVSPGKIPTSGGAVESGEEKTREPYTPASFIDLIRSHIPDAIDFRFHPSSKFSSEEDAQIATADIIIFATRNASLSPYQKDFGLSLAKTYGKKLIVIATCDPYDFLEEEEIKNYITIYEPTLPAFKAAIDVVFGVTNAQGSLPVGSPSVKYDIRDLTTSDEDFERVWQMWQSIFPKWPIEQQRMKTILTKLPGQHYIHEKGFCLSFLVDGEHGRIAAVGVSQEYRGKGLGTALIRKAQAGLRNAVVANGGELKSLEIGSLTPRFWPQVPVHFPPEVKNFFLHRGTSLYLCRTFDWCAD